MKILIVTFVADTHTQTLLPALKSLGHQVEILYSNALINYHRTSMRFSNDRYQLRYQNLEHPIESYDVIWYRRHSKVSMPDDLHEEDRKIAASDWSIFQRSARYICSHSNAFVINPVTEQYFANLKPAQLRIAQQVGLSIPDTIITNDPAEIRGHLEKHGQLVFKTFIAPTWLEDNGDAFEFFNTSIKDASSITDDASLMPGIYQNYVEKAYEVRLVVMGRTLFSVKIDSQTDPDAQFDWRTRPGYTEGLTSVIETPNIIRRKIHKFLDKSGIIFGSFDFIVSPAGDWIFLEINTGGQFLWLEGDLPQLPLVDAFCKFVESRDPKFQYDPTEITLKLSDFTPDLSMGDYGEPAEIPAYSHPYVVKERETGV